MAACLSPSPSGRRLSELLEEKQEPFVLDLHLLEKGCSSRLLDGYDTALCWPAPGNDAAAAVLKRLTSSNRTKTPRRSSRGGKILKLLLNKVIRGKQQQQASRGRKKKTPAALHFSDSFKPTAAVAPAPCAAADHLKKKREAEESYYHSGSDSYDSDDSEDEKQLSPVSVLDHPFESSPVHGGKLALSLSSPSKTYAVEVFRDLLDAAYAPALLTQLLLAKSDDDDLATDTTTPSSADADADAEEDKDDDCYYGYRASPKTGREAAYWEAHRAELARVSELVASEVPTARLDHTAVLPEREDVGAAVAAAVLDALLHELVVDLGTCCC